MIFIKGNTPSSKNGKRWTGRMLIHSKSTMTYIKSSKHEWRDNAATFISQVEEFKNKGGVYPLLIGFHFVRGSRHRFDQINMLQVCLDLMVEHGWIEDDNTDIVMPVPLIIEGKYYTYNVENPGVYIKLMQD